MIFQRDQCFSRNTGAGRELGLLHVFGLPGVFHARTNIEAKFLDCG